MEEEDGDGDGRTKQKISGDGGDNDGVAGGECIDIIIGGLDLTRTIWILSQTIPLSKR